MLLLAKNPASATPLTQMFEQGAVKKCYLFIARNHSRTISCNDQFEINYRLSSEKRGFGEKRIYVQHHPAESTVGKHATTHFKILYHNQQYTIGLAFPQTGRQHQIRVHALVAGLPLVGDKLYLGGYPLFQRFKENQVSNEDYDLMEIPRHALHALAINLPYPQNGQRTTFTAPIPEDLIKLIASQVKTDPKNIEQQIQQQLELFSNLNH
jgi:23S rRNA pseudouridine1911/1915/1917 synthase